MLPLHLLTLYVTLDLSLGNAPRTLTLQQFNPKDNTVSSAVIYRCNDLEQYNVVYILVHKVQDNIQHCQCTLRTSYTSVLLNVQAQVGPNTNNWENVISYKAIEDWTLVSQVYYADMIVNPATLNITLNTGVNSFDLDKNLRIAGGTVDIICNKHNFTRTPSTINEYFEKSSTDSQQNHSRNPSRKKSLTAALIALFFLLAVVIVIGVVLFMLYRKKKLCIKQTKAGKYKCDSDQDKTQNNNRREGRDEEKAVPSNCIELHVINNHLSIEDALRSGNMQDKNYQSSVQNQKHVSNVEPTSGGSLVDGTDEKY